MALTFLGASYKAIKVLLSFSILKGGFRNWPYKLSGSENIASLLFHAVYLQITAEISKIKKPTQSALSYYFTPTYF